LLARAEKFRAQAQHNHCADNPDAGRCASRWRTKPSPTSCCSAGRDDRGNMIALVRKTKRFEEACPMSFFLSHKVWHTFHKIPGRKPSASSGWRKPLSFL
jgi:hypothetical protein